MALLELLLTLALISLTIPMITPLLSKFHQWVRTVGNHHESMLHAERIRSSFYDVIKAHDSHRLLLSPRIHTGRLTFQDGTPLSYRILGDAITAIELASGAIALVRSQVASGSYTDIEFCTSPHRVLPDTLHGFLALGVDSITEFQGAHWPSNPRGCSKGRFSTPLHSMMTAQSGSQEEWHVLVPILRIFTLYVDEEHTLYYLSHEGDGIVERQPIQDFVGPLRIRSQFSDSDFSFQVTPLSLPQDHTYSYQSQLTRRTPWNLILHDTSASLAHRRGDARE